MAQSGHTGGGRCFIVSLLMTRMCTGRTDRVQRRSPKAWKYNPSVLFDIFRQHLWCKNIFWWYRWRNLCDESSLRTNLCVLQRRLKGRNWLKVLVTWSSQKAWSVFKNKTENSLSKTAQLFSRLGRRFCDLVTHFTLELLAELVTLCSQKKMKPGLTFTKKVKDRNWSKGLITIVKAAAYSTRQWSSLLERDEGSDWPSGNY